MKKSLANQAMRTTDQLSAEVKNRLKRMQHRPDLIVSYTAKTSLNFHPL